MQAYHVHPGKNFDGIVAIRRAQLAPGPYEVRVRIRAVALNYRDLMVIRGDYSGGDAAPVVPASDGAGDVVEVGDKVTASRSATASQRPSSQTGSKAARRRRNPATRSAD